MDQNKDDLSLKAYLSIYGKTKADIKKLSKPLQEAWYDEYRDWFKKKQRELNPTKDRRTPEEIETEDCYALLAEIGVPFVGGEPIGTQ